MQQDDIIEKCVCFHTFWAAANNNDPLYLEALCDVQQCVRVVWVKLQVRSVHVVQNLSDAPYVLNRQMEHIVFHCWRVLEQRSENTHTHTH